MRILMLTQRLPYAPNRGDRLRAYHMLQQLRDHAEVELVSLVHDEEEASHVGEMKGLVSRVTPLRVRRVRSAVNAAGALLRGTPLTHALLDAPGMAAALDDIVRSRRPDVVLAYCSSMAKFAMRPPLDAIPMVLDFVDVDSAKWRAMAADSGPPLSWIYRREASTLGAFEARAARTATTALVVNGREADLARELAPDANVRVVCNGVETERLRPVQPPAGKPQVVFCGVMSYAPNNDGIRWFIDAVWPLVRSERHDATLTIVGADPAHGLRAMASKDSSITVTGRVPDVRQWLWESAVGIAPLHVARGVQNKALEAIAAGLPIVITQAVADGLPPVTASASFVANTPVAFAQHILQLLRLEPDERRRIAESSDLSTVTWSRTLQNLRGMLDHAIRRDTVIAAQPSAPLVIQ